MLLPITNIQRFCMHDGPGIRTTVFLKGCPLRCKWCHNPETRELAAEILYDAKKCIGCGGCSICDNNAHLFDDAHIYDRSRCITCGKCVLSCPTGALEKTPKYMSIDEILNEVKKDMAFYGDVGGITVSGGEPMYHPKETIALLRAAKEQGISTAVETCGFFDEKYISELCSVTDCFLWDFKDSDEERHKKNTGVSLKPIIRNLKEVNRLGGNIILRCLIIKGINLTDEHTGNIKKLYNELDDCHKVDFIAYHPMGSSKYGLLGREDDFDDKCYIPDKEDIEKLNNMFKSDNH